LGELENLSETELEAYIAEHNSNEARFMLGRLLLEGSSDKIKRNDKKAINWIKEAINNGNLDALEYKTYYDIRYDKQPKMKKLFKNLETIIEKTKSTRACNTLAEFN
jgi:TPR repeat protein